MIRRAWMLAVLTLASSCSRDDLRSASEGGAVAAPPPAPSRVSLGNVMVQVARRFEIAGKAAVGRRYELAAFEAGELQELFESDVLEAEAPKEGPIAQIPSMAKAFLATNAPELKRAAASGDAKAFALAFERAAIACNACHSASAKGFIQIPATPGASVPEVEPPAPSAGAPPPSTAPR